MGELEPSSLAALNCKTWLSQMPLLALQLHTSFPGQRFSHQKHFTSSFERANLHTCTKREKGQLQPKRVVTSPHWSTRVKRSSAHTSGQCCTWTGLRENNKFHSYRLQHPQVKDAASNEIFAVTPFPSQTTPLPTHQA